LAQSGGGGQGVPEHLGPGSDGLETLDGCLGLAAGDTTASEDGEPGKRYGHRPAGDGECHETAETGDDEVPVMQLWSAVRHEVVIFGAHLGGDVRSWQRKWQQSEAGAGENQACP
jgi:hypothetical protein